MNLSDDSTSEAAELVLKERQRQRELERRTKQAGDASDKAVAEPTLEQVSVPKWEGAEAGEVDESELDRRQRAISERLERKQREVHEQGKELARVRAELKALEEPIKAEIMQLREKLESANRTEKGLVETVNALRKDLFEREKELSDVRATKQDLADGLIGVMADYEKRKTERLNEIAALVGGEAVPKKTAAKSNFAGF